MQVLRKVMMALVCSLGLVIAAKADVLETNNAINRIYNFPGHPDPIGIKPADYATLVNPIPGPDGVVGQWLTQEITLPSNATLNSITIGTLNGDQDDFTLLIGGQVFTQSTVSQYSDFANDIPYYERTFELSGLSVSSTFTLTLKDNWAVVSLADTDYYDSSKVKNATYVGWVISWEDWENKIDNKVPYINSASSALQFSLNYTVAAVPEPETYLMMLSGVALLSGVVARRKRKAIANAG